MNGIPVPPATEDELFRRELAEKILNPKYKPTAQDRAYIHNLLVGGTVAPKRRGRTRTVDRDINIAFGFLQMRSSGMSRQDAIDSLIERWSLPRQEDTPNNAFNQAYERGYDYLRGMIELGLEKNGGVYLDDLGSRIFEMMVKCRELDPSTAPRPRKEKRIK